MLILVVGVVEAPAEVHVPQLAGPVVLLPREEVAGRPPIFAVLGCGAEPRALAFRPGNVWIRFETPSGLSFVFLKLFTEYAGRTSLG